MGYVLTAEGVGTDIETGQGRHSGDIEQGAGAVYQYGSLSYYLRVLTN